MAGWVALFFTPIKSAPNGKWLTAMGEQGLYLFPFDHATAAVGDPVILPELSPRVEFSPNGRYLFAIDTEITRFDLTAADIEQSKTVIGSFPEIPDTNPFVLVGNPQLGPDGKIYIPTVYFTTTGGEIEFLSVITCPNQGGALLPNELECALVGNGNIFFSLPNFPAQWLYLADLDPMAIPADTVVTPGSPVQLLASNGVEYDWSPPAQLSCADCPDPIAVVDESTTFYVSIMDISGCQASDSVHILVEPALCDLEVPNAFTPDGDQLNDLFRPVGIQTLYHLRVWNRWGNLVFDNAGSGTPWDGTQDGGTRAPSDVYAWTLEADVCGEVKQLKGEVSLLR
ncbi:MAG: gliding motility-associated C-terminal domain-containing protein [Saprospirales bacterium]|nr:gliding motility-associated C-terminal domain-containing protein [Saprospirales bacterium]